MYFSRSSASASARYFIDKNGSIRQSVREGDTAWHAGSLCKMRKIKLERIRFRGHAPTKPLGFTSKDIVADTASRCQ